MSLLTTEMKAWIGRSEPPLRIEITRRDIQKYSIATEQTKRAYLDGDEAPPMFVFNLFRPLVGIGQLQTDGLPPGVSLPELPLKRTMAAGTRLQIERPIRAGDILVGTLTLTDIFEKSGSQGPLIFFVNELRVTTDSGEPVLTEIQTQIAR